MPDLLILALGILLAEAVACIAPLVANRCFWTRALGLRLLVGSAVLLAFVPTQNGVVFAFKTVSRETGVWRDPNLYGVYMGIALVAAGGLLVDSVARNTYPSRLLVFERIALTIAGCILAAACLRSYSRGAWLASLFGVLFTVSASLRVILKGAMRPDRRVQITRLGTVFWALASLALLAYAGGKQIGFRGIPGTDSPYLVRLATVTDSNDLSWINRVHAWKGSMRLLVEHPLVGIGFDAIAPAYAELYKPETVSSEAAIKTNDVTLLGVAMGLPVLLAIGIIVFVSFSPAGASAIDQNTILAVTWRGILVASLISHWFNGTLLTWLPGGLFWVAVAMGVSCSRPGPLKCTEARQQNARPNGGRWSRLVIACGFSFAILVMVMLHLRGLALYPAFHAKDRLFVLGIMPRGNADAIAVICAPGSEARNGFGGLPQMRDLGFATFGIYSAGNLPIAADDWTATISECIAKTRGGELLRRVYIIFGPGSAAVCTDLLGTASGSSTKFCWLGVDWKRRESVIALEETVRELERRHISARAPSELALYCLPGDMAEVRSTLAPMADRLQKQGISVLIRGSIAANGDDLRPLALREIAKQVRADFRLPAIHWPVREAPINFSRITAAFESAFLLATATTLVWWATRITVVPNLRSRLLIGVASLTWLLVTIVAFQIVWPSSSRPSEWLNGPMVPLRLKEDYREVTRSIDESKVTAREVLEYVEITAHQTGRIYSSLPKSLYREFVLPPTEATWGGAEMRFRVDMWRFLRGHLASSGDPLEAAHIVRRRLLNAVGGGDAIDLDLMPLSEAWRRGMISQSQLPSLHVMALRAAGVAARLRENRVEIWAADRWQVTAPVPANSI